MEAFENLSDPRDGRAKRHYFGEVLFIALAAMVSGMDDFADFERFAEERGDWRHGCGSFHPLPNEFQLPYPEPGDLPRPDQDLPLESAIAEWGAYRQMEQVMAAKIRPITPTVSAVSLVNELQTNASSLARN